MSKTHTVTSLADLGTLKPDTTRNIDGLQLLLEQDRVVAVSGLRSLAGSLQLTLVNTAFWHLRMEDRKARAEALGIDLDQRNAQDEKDRTSAEEREHGHPMGFEMEPTPLEKLSLHAGLYDDVLHELEALNPTEFEMPRPIPDTVDWVISNQNVPEVAESTLEALRAAGIDDSEFADAAEKTRLARQERMRQRRTEIIQLIEDTRGNGDAYAFTKLPLHIQLRLMCSVWKGLHARRKQLVMYIASSGKLDELGDTQLLKNGMDNIERWCREFEAKHSQLFDAMIEAGVTVLSIDDAKQAVANKRKQ